MNQESNPVQNFPVWDKQISDHERANNIYSSYYIRKRYNLLRLRGYKMCQV